MGCENQSAIRSSNPSIVLDIPTRLQWENGHGFCGETCIQTCSLYYGNYISQLEVRKIAGGEVLLGNNAEETIQKLGYEIEVWDNQRPKPQHKEYLQWIKKMISRGYPVIICGYAPDGENDEYDHIYLAIGVKSENIDEYSDEDSLYYMDMFDQEVTVTSFGKVCDNKGMKNTANELAFAIPKNVNYGIAVKGIKDPQDQFLPVQLKLGQKSQPNVSMNEQPKQFSFQIEVSELTVGKRYALLRYDNYKSLPTKSVVQNQASEVDKFVATANIYTKTDVVSSNKSVFYRCVEEENLC